jgi:hypothetical protein
MRELHSAARIQPETQTMRIVGLVTVLLNWNDGTTDSVEGIDASVLDGIDELVFNAAEVMRPDDQMRSVSSFVVSGQVLDQIEMEGEITDGEQSDADSTVTGDSATGKAGNNAAFLSSAPIQGDEVGSDLGSGAGVPATESSD